MNETKMASLICISSVGMISFTCESDDNGATLLGRDM